MNIITKKSNIVVTLFINILLNLLTYACTILASDDKPVTGILAAVHHHDAERAEQHHGDRNNPPIFRYPLVEPVVVAFVFSQVREPAVSLVHRNVLVLGKFGEIVRDPTELIHIYVISLNYEVLSNFRIQSRSPGAKLIDVVERDVELVVFVSVVDLCLILLIDLETLDLGLRARAHLLGV